ncbi:MAG: YbeF family protein [Clostridia bacterium]|nr:YbeF family protein [Clostridia bacterium]
MNLLLFFAFPIATIIFSIVLQKIIRNPILVALTIFAAFLIATFSVFDESFLIYTIVYTIISYITAIITRLAKRFFRRLLYQQNQEDDNDGDNNDEGPNDNSGESNCGCDSRADYYLNSGCNQFSRYRNKCGR